MMSELEILNYIDDRIEELRKEDKLILDPLASFDNSLKSIRLQNRIDELEILKDKLSEF